jgi:hypothetical protein
MPGTDDVTRESGLSAPGSADPGQVPGMTGTTTDSAFVTNPDGQIVSGVRVPVSADSTLIPAQTGLYSGDRSNLISGGITGGQAGRSGAGDGTAVSPRHPNAQGRADL